MWIIPGWAIGTGFLIVVVGVTQVVVRRLLGRVGWSPAERPSGPDLTPLTQTLEDIQRRLGELEERMDFAERVLTKDREPDRLAPPDG
jgi:hypothetical protein